MMNPLSARRTRAVGLLLLLLGLATGSSASPLQSRRCAVELTFLKSNPGHREHLKAFIVRNWFAMDSIAKSEGLLSAFTVLDTGTDDGPWNVVVAVTYREEKGYEGIAPAFERIRRAHTTVQVDGRVLRELGAIVESKRLFEDQALTSP